MALVINQVEKKIGCFEIALVGRLDNETSARLLGVVNALFQSRVNALQFNMRALDYVSSAGLRVILMAMKAAKKANAIFMVMEMQEPVKKVFEIAQMVPMNEIFASVKEADDYFDEIQRRERQKQGGAGN